MRIHSVIGGVTLGGRVLAALVSLTILAVGGFYWSTYRSFAGGVKGINVFPSASGPSASTSPDIDGSAQNIIIAGNDDRSHLSGKELAELGTTDDGGSLNTDTIMVLHVPADSAAAFAISFPRDLVVPIPGHEPDRINSAYPDGYAAAAPGSSQTEKQGAGGSLLRQTIENLTGITVDHFVMVNLLSFYDISNAIGGVTLCLNEDARPARYIGETGTGIDSGYEDGQWVNSYTHIDLHKGINRNVKGLQALAFVRQRHGLTSDLDRITRQQYFLTHAFARIKSAGFLTDLSAQRRLFSAISKNLVVDRSQPGHRV